MRACPLGSLRDGGLARHVAKPAPGRPPGSNPLTVRRPRLQVRLAGVQETPAGPLLSFHSVRPCPPAPRKARPPPGYFDLSGEAPVRRLDFVDDDQEPLASPSTSAQAGQAASMQPAHQPAPAAQPHVRPPLLFVPEDSPPSAARQLAQAQTQHGMQQPDLSDLGQQQQQQQQQPLGSQAWVEGRGAPAPFGDTTGATRAAAGMGPLPSPHQLGGGPALARPQRQQHQRQHPYQPRSGATGNGAALMDLASPTAPSGPYASPLGGGSKRTPATPVRLFR